MPKGGYFGCKACGNPLYSAEAKFHSGCGWPSFDKCYAGSTVNDDGDDSWPWNIVVLLGSVKTVEDRSLGSVRTEIICSRCGGHLGHVFSGERSEIVSALRSVYAWGQSWNPDILFVQWVKLSHEASIVGISYMDCISLQIYKYKWAPLCQFCFCQISRGNVGITKTWRKSFTLISLDAIVLCDVTYSIFDSSL